MAETSSPQDIAATRQILLDGGFSIEQVDIMAPLEADQAQPPEPPIEAAPVAAPGLEPELAAPETSPVMEGAPEEDTSFFEDVGNIWMKALVGGYGDIDSGVLEGVTKGLNQAVELVGGPDAVEFGEEVNRITGTGVVPDPQSETAKTISKAVQTGIGIIPAMRLFKAIGVSNAAFRGILGGVAGDFATGDKELAEEMVGFLKLVPSELGGDATERFALVLNEWMDETDNLDDRDLRARLVNAGFGIPLGLAGEAFLPVVTTVARLAKRAGTGAVQSFKEMVDSTLGTGTSRAAVSELDQAREAVGSRIVSGNVKPRRNESVSHYIYRQLVDRMHPLSRLTKMLADGVPLPANLDPYKLARIGVASASRANMFLEYGVRSFSTNEVIGPSLKEILAPVKGRLEDFEKYAVSRRAIELEGREIESGVSIRDARIIVERESDAFAEAFAQLVTYQDNMTRYLADSGVVSKELVEKIREANKDYVPFYRLMDEEDGLKWTSAGGTRKPIKAIKGSEREIHNPLESVIKNTYMYVELAHRNAVGTALVDLAERSPLGAGLVKRVEPTIKPTTAKFDKTASDVIASLPDVADFLKQYGVKLSDEELTIFRAAQQPLRSNQISIFRNGKQEIYEVDEHVAKIVQGHTAESINLLARIAAYPARTLRAGAILDPAFFAKNMMRDNVTAFIYSTSGFKPFSDWISGFVSMLKKDEHWQQWQSSGGPQATLMSLDREFLQHNLQKLIETTSMYSLAKNVVTTPLEILRIGSDLAENATRVGEFKKAVKQLSTDTRRPSAEVLAEAAFRSREVTLDFARMGATIRGWNMVTPFLNARIQGWDRMVRGFIDHPVQFNAKAIASITAPSVYLWYANHDNPIYQELPDWEKAMFWHIFPSGDDPNGTIWRIPKPFELGILYGTFVERILDALYDSDGFDIEELAENLFGAIGPSGVASYVPTAAAPIAETLTNYDFFRNRPIVSARDERVLPADQYDVYSSPAAIAVGRLLEKFDINGGIASPRHIENNVGNLTGSLGRYFLEGLDRILEFTGAVETRVDPAEPWTRWPFIRSFTTRYPSLQAESVNTFFENYQKAEKSYNSMMRNIKGENAERAAMLLEQGASVFKPLETYNQAMSVAMTAIKRIHAANNITPEDKTRQIDALTFHIIDLAKSANKMIEKFEKEREESAKIFGDNFFD